MRVILNFAAAQPFVKVRDVIALDPPLSTACQNMSQRQLVERSSVYDRGDQVAPPPHSENVLRYCAKEARNSAKLFSFLFCSLKIKILLLV